MDSVDSRRLPDPPALLMSAPLEPMASDIPVAAPSRHLAAVDDAVVPMAIWRRWVTLFTICWLPIPMTFSTSSVLAVAPELAREFNVPVTAISIANAGVFLAMASSPLLWVPIGRLVGRRPAYLAAAVILCACSVGSALAPNLAGFTAIWVIGGSTGVVFLVSGQTILSDIFEPTVRGTAVGFFLGTCVSANTIAPLTGGIIATYTSWRVIYGVQAGMTLIGLVLAWFYVPLDPPREAQPTTSKHVLAQFSPMPVFRVFEHINILAANITCGLLSFNQYGLLGSIRSALTTRFGPSSPLTSGLFYLAPGAGFLIGSTIGGRLSDQTVRRYIKKRNGLRLPRDRLKSSFPAIFIVLPLGTLLFGWSLGREVGSWAAPGIGAFLAGLGLMASFSGLNTYSAEVLPAKKTEAISSKYIVQYTFAAGTVASRVPIMEAIGVGWAFTISAVAALAGGVIVLMITRYEPETEKTLREEAE
ncbi:hypothetical protein VD0004_g1137 [Verticillium dahliae]|uniref:Major facilitator superfamily (MFS) profile domain-containing protein n=1 Tax=Verticillium dahliae TaxID=27337 RepID=A0A444RMB4_VERDA|nr:hypothetical protein VD0004_g1137 [Verticillium dahliae]PNH76761.1 hypothetical protein VD0001_g792 [Verticillium dahliae]RXG42252.1 hypothetical protein VDGE_07235 [Verticillium dahliae]